MILQPVYMPPAPKPRQWLTEAAAARRAVRRAAVSEKTENKGGSEDQIEDQTSDQADGQPSEGQMMKTADQQIADLQKQITELKKGQEEFGTKKLIGDVAGGILLEEGLRRGYNKVSKTERYQRVATKVGGKYSAAKQSITGLLKAAGQRIAKLGGAAGRGIGKAAGFVARGLTLLVSAAGIKVMVLILALCYVARLGKRLYQYKKNGLPPGMTGKEYFFNSLVPFKGLPPQIHGSVAKAVLQEPAFRKQLSELPGTTDVEITDQLKKLSKTSGKIKLSKSEKDKLVSNTIQRANESGIKLKAAKTGLEVTASSVYIGSTV